MSIHGYENILTVTNTVKKYEVNLIMNKFKSYQLFCFPISPTLRHTELQPPSHSLTTYLLQETETPNQHQSNF